MFLCSKAENFFEDMTLEKSLDNLRESWARVWQQVTTWRARGGAEGDEWDTTTRDAGCNNVKSLFQEVGYNKSISLLNGERTIERRGCKQSRIKKIVLQNEKPKGM